MKTTSTLLTALFLSMASFAIPVQSKLSITVIGNKNIEIIVDNNRYQSQENSVLINSLQPGSHVIKVYSLKKNQRKNAWGNNTQLIYSSTVYVRPGYFVGITIDRNGKAIFDERSISGNRRNDNRNDDRVNRENRYDQNNPYNDHDNSNNYGRQAVSEQSFSSMVQALRREYSEHSRLALAKEIINQTYFSTAQVKYMMQLFSFENNKLELAKYAYRNTVDQRNYFVVYDGLSYTSSKDQLADYIRRFK